MRAHPLLVSGVLAAAVLTGAGCDDASVTLRFAPRAGDVYEYRFEVDLRSQVELGEIDNQRDDTSRLDARFEVEAVDADGTRAVVTVEREGAPAERIVVLVAPGAQLAAIDLTEVLTADDGILGGFDRLAGSVTSDLPRSPVVPGQRWRVSGGSATLARLGADGGVDTAFITSDREVRVDDSVEGAEGVTAVRGVQQIDRDATYALGDGALRASITEVVGDLHLVVTAPTGIAAPAVRGTLRYELTISAWRIG